MPSPVSLATDSVGPRPPYSHGASRADGVPGDLASWLKQGPFTLALSSSFFGFYAHCGVTAALYELGYKPNRFSGASAGALVAAWLAGGRDPLELRDLIFELKPSDFWDPKMGFGYLKGDKFRAILRSRMGRYFWELTYPLEVAVYDVLSRQTEFLHQGLLAEAVSASCAVPILFHPVKFENKYYLDGGITRKSGLHHERVLAEDERALCLFIESRVKGGGYERRGWPPDHPQLRVWSFHDLPSVDFRRLETGRAAYEHAYQLAKQILTSQAETAPSSP